MGSIPQVSLLKGPAHSAGTRRRLHQLFSDTARREHDNPAIIIPDCKGKGEEITFGSADSTSNRLARSLLSLVRPAENADGDRVVVVNLPPSSELILVLLAVWKAGAAYLPLEPSPPPHRVKHILKEAKPFLVITTKEDKHLFGDTERTTTVDDLKEAAKGLEETSLSSSRSVAVGDPIEIILYTSGSTGLSKGVRIRNSSCLNRLQWGWREFPFPASERVCVFKTALTFVDSVPELWGSLLAGRPVLVLPKDVTADPQRLVAILHKYKVERLILVPTLLKAILTYLDFSPEKNDVLNSLKLWVCSGESLAVSLAYDFFKKFGEDKNKTLCNFYGSTEIMGDVTYHVMRSANEVAVDGKVPIGSPVDNTQIYLLDKDLEIVKAGSIGEIYVGGKHIAAGYVSGRDAFRFVHSPHAVDPDFNILFKTGDYGRVEKNLLLYEGRTDSQIKVRGHRVDLSEVEAALGRVKGVEKGVALCYKPGESDQEVLGFILLEQGAKLDATQIQQTLKNSLQSYAIPQIVFIDSVPLLNNGKVDRQQLLRIYQKNSSEAFEVSDYSGIKPGNEKAAECLFRAVFSVLGQPSRSKISGTANFYQIGGNSLNSVLTIAKIKEAGYNIGISDFIRAQNLAEIANEMVFGHSENGYHSQKEKYSLDFIDEKYKGDIYRVIGDSFVLKADLELTMDPPVKRNEYDILLDSLWPTLIKQKLSIVLKNKQDEVIGVSLFMDIADEPEVHLDTQLKYIFQFLEYLEVPVIETMLPEGKILHSFMLGTDQKLSGPENIEVTEILERQIEDIGKSRGYVGIFTTNTSPLTQQLAENILNYKKLKTYQVNQFVAPDGTRPFKRGDNTLVAVCSFKRL